MPKLMIAKKRQLNIVDESEDEVEPQREITKNVKGQIRKYDFLKTVQSLEELDQLRFKVCPN
jgi:ribosomal protein S28E/S33